MDTMLIIIGALGFAIIAVSAYVFTVAARNYVSTEEPYPGDPPSSDAQGATSDRRHQERRSGISPQFPLTVNGLLVPADRRRHPERRGGVF